VTTFSVLVDIHDGHNHVGPTQRLVTIG